MKRDLLNCIFDSAVGLAAAVLSILLVILVGFTCIHAFMLSKSNERIETVTDK